MPPRPHPLVLAALAFGFVVVMALVMPRAAGAAAWRWPVHGPVVGAFHLSPRAPYARGQRRGIDVSSPPGARVRAACSGRVTFAGAVPRRALAVSVRCGALAATYLGLGGLAVRRGSRVEAGDVLGTLGPAGRLRLGARHAADRRGYVDPRSLLRDDVPPLPRLGPAPRSSRPRFHGPLPAAAPALHPAPAPTAGPAPAPHRLPWPAYPAVALVAAALPVGGLVHRRRRRARAARVVAARARPVASAPGRDRAPRVTV